MSVTLPGNYADGPGDEQHEQRDDGDANEDQEVDSGAHGVVSFEMAGT